MATATPVRPASSTLTAANPAGGDSFERTLASARSTMPFREVLALAVDSFRASKTRFLLTMLGMVIGSASVILVATVGSTGKQYAIDTISSLGPNKVEMQYSGGAVAGADHVATQDLMTRDDMIRVREELGPEIVASSPMLEFHEPIPVGNGVSKDMMLLGVSPQYKEVRGLRVRAGRFFDDADAAGHAKVAVLVKPLAKLLYGDYTQAVGRTVSVRGIPFTIVGVFEESIDTFGQSEISEDTMLIPYEVGRYFEGTDNVKEIFFQTATTDEVEQAAKQITTIISNRHRPSSVYRAQTLTDILSSMRKIANMLTIVLLLASAITLIVSGVGIMNSMLANVQSRIREIGIRKALGATRREIRLQFLTESVFLSLGGGLIGTALGLAIPFSVSLFMPDISIPISPWSAVAALLTSMGVGILFGTLPANRAARLDPVSTLKYE